MSKDYYSILNAHSNTTPQEIKNQYKKLALVLHPDKSGPNQDFVSISEASKILVDPVTNALYQQYQD